MQELAQAREQARTTPAPNLSLEIQHAGCNGIEMLIEDLQAEIAEYERLKSGHTKTFSLPSVLDDLPAALTQARVARCWSHRELAWVLETTEQQVQKDESGGYARASLKRLHRVADALAMTVVGEAKLQPSIKRIEPSTGDARGS